MADGGGGEEQGSVLWWIEEGALQAEDSAWDSSSTTRLALDSLCLRVSPIKMGLILLHLLILVQILKSPRDSGWFLIVE